MCEPWAGNSTMTRNIKMKNGDYSGDLGTENYCKDATLVSIVIAIKIFGSLDTQDYGLASAYTCIAKLEGCWAGEAILHWSGRIQLILDSV